MEETGWRFLVAEFKSGARLSFVESPGPEHRAGAGLQIGLGHSPEPFLAVASYPFRGRELVWNKSGT